jgi:hypothetical protein
MRKRGAKISKRTLLDAHREIELLVAKDARYEVLFHKFKSAMKMLVDAVRERPMRKGRQP